MAAIDLLDWNAKGDSELDRRSTRETTTGCLLLCHNAEESHLHIY